MTTTTDTPEVTALVLDVLGRPSNLWRAEAKNVFDNCYRVNIWLETETSELSIPVREIAHSYFVIYDGEKIVRSNPDLEPIKDLKKKVYSKRKLPTREIKSKAEVISNSGVL
tara:strand:+ start:1784 stop:2119 length:336 start_codon:yes stop_codon:yes gene_type:complete